MIEFARGMDLPKSVVTQTLAIIGRKGSGKTYTAGKLVEGIVDAGAQVIVIDPVGNWWGLRLGSGGTGKGLEIPIIGGDQGDLPITEGSGRVLAEFLVSNRRSAVLDIMQFRKAERVRFVTALAEEIFQLKKASRTPVHIVLEEAHKFIPEQKGRSKADLPMVGAWEDIIRLGRNYGIGVTMISQRPQSISKEVLNQTECLICHQLTGPHERKAIKDWVVDKDLEVPEMIDSLPALQAGEAYLWSPVWLGILQKIHVRKKKTFDASATPDVDGDYSAEAKPLAKMEIESLTTAMEQAVEEAKARDPKSLKKRIAELERSLAQAQKAEVDPAELKKVVGEAVQSERTRIAKAMQAELDRMANEFDQHTTKMRGLFECDCPDLFPVIPNAPRIVMATDPDRIVMPKKGADFSNLVPPDPDIDGLPTGESKILAAVIQFGGAKRKQLTTLTGFKRSTRDSYIQRLRAKGLVDVEGDKIVATGEGKSVASDVDPLPTGRELQQFWLSRLPAGEAKILEILLDHAPHAVSRDLISELSGFKQSTRNTYIQRMHAKEIVAITGGGIVASETLFA